MGSSVGDVMQTRLKTVSPDTPLREAEALLLREHVGGVPVVEDGVLVGLVSRSDVVKHLQAVQSLVEGALSAYDDGEHAPPPEASAQTVAADRQRSCVRDAMTTEVVTTSRDATLAEAARLMVEHRIHRLPVTEGGRLVGLVSSLDLARLVAEGRLSGA